MFEQKRLCRGKQAQENCDLSCFSFVFTIVFACLLNIVNILVGVLSIRCLLHQYAINCDMDFELLLKPIISVYFVL